MDKMIVVVFDQESKAFEGWKALQGLHEDGSISIHSMAVVAKSPTGRLETKQTQSPVIHGLWIAAS
jgi:uncharacterized membrane protein